MEREEEAEATPAGDRDEDCCRWAPPCHAPVVLLTLPSRVCFFLKIFFCVWIILKVFIGFVTILLLLYVCLFVFGCKACRILSP